MLKLHVMRGDQEMWDCIQGVFVRDYRVHVAEVARSDLLPLLRLNAVKFAQGCCVKAQGLRRLRSAPGCQITVCCRLT